LFFFFCIFTDFLDEDYVDSGGGGGDAIMMMIMMMMMMMMMTTMSQLLMIPLQFVFSLISSSLQKRVWTMPLCSSVCAYLHARMSADLSVLADY
jgi:hypothetical protein